MKITQQFEVARDPASVWDFFQEIPSVAQCLPGAELTDVKDDGTYDGHLAVKLGPHDRFVRRHGKCQPRSSEQVSCD